MCEDQGPSIFFWGWPEISPNSPFSSDLVKLTEGSGSRHFLDIRRRERQAGCRTAHVSPHEFDTIRGTNGGSGVVFLSKVGRSPGDVGGSGFGTGGDL